MISPVRLGINSSPTQNITKNHLNNTRFGSTVPASLTEEVAALYPRLLLHCQQTSVAPIDLRTPEERAAQWAERLTQYQNKANMVAEALQKISRSLQSVARMEVTLGQGPGSDQYYQYDFATQAGKNYRIFVPKDPQKKETRKQYGLQDTTGKPNQFFPRIFYSAHPYGIKTDQDSFELVVDRRFTTLTGNGLLTEPDKTTYDPHRGPQVDIRLSRTEPLAAFINQHLQPPVEAGFDALIQALETFPTIEDRGINPRAMLFTSTVNI